MINLEFVFRLVEFTKGAFNTTMYLLGLRKKPKKKEGQQASKTHGTLKNMNFLAELYLSMRAGTFLLVDMSHLLSQPSMSVAVVIALAPPPLLIALYAVTAAYQSYKIAKELPVLFREDVSGHDHQKARMEIAHAALVLTASLAIIASNFILPGAINILALSCIVAGAVVKGAQYCLASFSKRQSAVVQAHASTLLPHVVNDKPVIQDINTLAQAENPLDAQDRPIVIEPEKRASRIKVLEEAIIAAEKKCEKGEPRGAIELEAKGEKTQKVEPTSLSHLGTLEEGALQQAEHQKAEEKPLHRPPEYHVE